VILLIDIGNSRIKWASLSKGKLHPGDDIQRPEEPRALVSCAENHWKHLKKPSAVVVSNVAGPAFAAALNDWAISQWQVPVHFVIAEKSAFGIINAYTVPERFGPDRWAALIAARRRYDGAVCVVDAGTAVTIDVLGDNGAHQGGLIIPGLNMMRRALLDRTQDILAATIEPVRGGITLLARDTRDGVDGGTLYTLVAVIDRVVTDVGAELGSEPTCVITGGDAAALLPLLAGEYHYAPELVLEGLAVIAEKL
jgi:type III pantothenate kinase